jgi:hypothetical protein
MILLGWAPKNLCGLLSANKKLAGLNKAKLCQPVSLKF